VRLDLAIVVDVLDRGTHQGKMCCTKKSALVVENHEDAKFLIDNNFSMQSGQCVEALS
jgi:hypothetical protein